jgi:hypothetical protein
MKGGMQFFDRQPPDTGYISLYGDGDGDEQNKLQYTKKTVQTHLKTEDNKSLIFTLYNIESFNKYENENFDLSNLSDDIIDINSIEHLYLCGFLTKISRRELFIKKGKVGEEGNKETRFKAIGKTLYKLLSENIKIKTEKIKDKIQIILAHSKEKNTLCIIFNMSNMHSNYYKSLKNSLPYTLFSDEKNLEKKIEKSQLENLIEFTNEKLVIKPIADSSKTRFLLGLLFQDAAAAGLGSTTSVAFPDEVYDGGGGGNNTKELRQKLNTMSIKQLKRLSDKNHIKYGNKNTIKSLINNYMKHI